MMHKEYIKTNVSNPGLELFEGRVQDIQKNLADLITHHGEDVEITWEYDWNDYREPVVYVNRLETDEEFEQRKKTAENWAASIKKQELLTLQKLKEKYE